MPTIYFETTRVDPPRRYKVLKLDRANKKITLQGEYGPFEEDYDRERFEKLGYRLVQEEEVTSTS